MVLYKWCLIAQHTVNIPGTPLMADTDARIGPKWVRLTPNRTNNLDFFRLDFSTQFSVWLAWRVPDLSHLWSNMTHFVRNSGIPACQGYHISLNLAAAMFNHCKSVLSWQELVIKEQNMWFKHNWFTIAACRRHVTVIKCVSVEQATPECKYKFSNNKSLDLLFGNTVRSIDAWELIELKNQTNKQGDHDGGRDITAFWAFCQPAMTCLVPK